MKISNFPRTHKKAKKLLKVFAEYEFESVVRACYCISIKRDNRSALENCLSLNEALIKYAKKKCGLKIIKDYYDFQVFFSKIESILPISDTDDYTIPDFGEVRLIFEGVAYKVYIGTGHTQVYSYLANVQTVAKELHLEDEFRRLLGYQDSIITYFEKNNKCTSNPGEVCFKIPEESLFQRIWRFFDVEIDNFDLTKINCLLPKHESRIEKQHFVQCAGNIFPLYNTTLVLDYMLAQIKNNKEETIACHSLYELINGIDPFSDIDTCHYLFPATVNVDNRLLEDFYINVVIMSRGGMTLCFDSNSWNKNKKRYIEIINGLKEKEFDVIETRKRSDKGNVAVRIKKGVPIKIISFLPVLNMDTSRIFFRDNVPGVLTCSSADFMEMIMFSDDENELWDFINWATSDRHSAIISLGGISSEFFAWKESGHAIEKGAVSFDFVDIGYNGSIEYIWSYFQKELHNYPWNLAADPMFSNPFAWNITHNEETWWDDYVIKSNRFGGKLLKLNNKTLFFCNNVAFYKNEQLADVNHIINDVLSLVEDIFIRMTYTCKAVWEKCSELENRLIEILFMPKSYYEKVSGEIVDESKSVYSGAIFHRGSLIIRFTVNDKALYEEISKATDRSAECRFYLNIFNSLQQYAPEFYALLEQQLQNIAYTEKHVGVVSITLPYKWNALSVAYKVDDVDYHEVRKRIAQIIDKENIEPGEYIGKEANTVIRKAQQALINDFESRVAVFDKKTLHVKLLEIYSGVIHKIAIDKKRYSAISNIDNAVKLELYGKIIREREKFKQQKRVLEYLIETNLFLNRESTQALAAKECQGLLAYANWLVVLTDNADICNFTDAEAHIEVSVEKVVDVIGKTKDNVDELSRRMYGDEGYGLSTRQQDKEFIERAKNAFEDDTGIELRFVLDFLDYLSKRNIGVELAPNVFEVLESELISAYLAEPQIELKASDIRKIIDFVSISPELLKTCEGRTDYYLPIGRRKERCNRFDIKGVWRNDNNVIYSPVHCNHIFDRWIRGIADFFLPYTIGLDNTVKVLKEWKRLYERQIVFDIERYFKEHGFSIVKPNFDLKKIDKTDKSLLRLGDCDVLAVDTVHKKIWVIECKVLAKVGSFYEMYKQQESFFLKKKEDEHFQTRIDFMTNNYHRVLDYLKCEDESEYEIIPYMVMNKVMISRYKQIGFPIISVSELYTEIDRLSGIG